MKRVQARFATSKLPVLSRFGVVEVWCCRGMVLSRYGAEADTLSNKKASVTCRHARFVNVLIGEHQLLIELLFNGFLGIFCAQSTPETVRTFTPSATFPAASVTVVATVSDMILIARFN